VQQGDPTRGANRAGFFLSDLAKVISEEDLMEEAYALVNKIGFSYTEVTGLTKKERLFYLNLYIKEKEAERKAYEAN